MTSFVFKALLFLQTHMNYFVQQTVFSYVI